MQLEMDFALARALTKTMISNVAKVTKKAPYMTHVALGEIEPAITGMCGVMPIKYHPGAVAAWEEAGYTIAECARP